MLQIRKATREDASIIVRFQLQMAMETEKLELSEAIVSKGVQHIFDTPEIGFYVVAEADRDVVSSLLVLSEWSDWRCGYVWWIHSVFVKPEVRRQKIFRQMYDHLKAEVASRDDLFGLRLYVEKENLIAQKTYEALKMDGHHYKLYQWMKHY